MTTFVAFHRALNVGKANRVSMKGLVDAYCELGHLDPQTYIASGNVWFDTVEFEEETLAATLEKHLRQTFQFEIPTMLRPLAELQQLVAEAPFTGDGSEKLNVAFLDRAPDLVLWNAVESAMLDGERIWLAGRNVYSACDESFAQNPKLAIARLEKLLKQRVTVRNWNTTVRMSQGR